MTGCAETLVSRSDTLKLSIRLTETMATRMALMGDDFDRRMGFSVTRTGFVDFGLKLEITFG